MCAAKRVVMYTASTSTGGAEVALRTLVHALDASYDVTVMGVDAATCEWIADGRRVAVVPPVRDKFAVGAFLAHRRVLRRLRPDVFHANLREMADARHALLAALTVRGVRTIAVDHLPLAPTNARTRAITRFVSKRLDRRVAVGERVARLVEDALGLAHGCVGTIYNGVPDVAIEPRESGAPRLGVFARLDRVKGIDVLLDAIAPLDVAVVIAGDGPERSALAAQAARLGIAERVELVGWRDDARSLLGSIDVFVLPSRTEGLPLSIIEAMLARCAVLATAVGSVDEVVVDGETGFVVPPDDAEALRSAIATLIADPDRRREMGERGRRRALDRFSVEKMAAAFEALYDEVSR